mgnify:CR=1 FL=1
MNRSLSARYAAGALIGAAALAGVCAAGCGPKEEPPATPPTLPPVPPRPANQGPQAERYNQMMNQRGDASKTPAAAPGR